MRKDIRSAVVAIVVMTVVLGLVYPLVVTGIGQVAFPNAADGSTVEVDGKVVGSKLIGQDFSTGRTGQYFQSRPSVTGYAPDATFFNNRGPNQATLAVQQRRFVLDYLARERPYVPSLRADAVPPTRRRRRPRASIRTSRSRTRASRPRASPRCATSRSPGSARSSTSTPTDGSPACSVSPA